MCPKSCSALEYTGYVDYTASNVDITGEYGAFYWPKPNETYFSLTIRHKHPATVTIHEEYVIIDTFGLFVGFSFFDVITLLMKFYQKVHDQINQRNSIF